MSEDREVFEFQWDKGNIDKNRKHKVQNQESEDVFLDEKKVILKDVLHSVSEKRFIALGRSRLGRLLYVVFAKRGLKIRVTSARNINQKEVHLYEKTVKNS